MSDTNTKNYFKDLAKASNKPCAQCFLFVALDKVIEDQPYLHAFLSKEKRKVKVRMHLTSLVEEYTNKLEPLGGSWAGSANPDGPPNIERVMNNNMENLTDDVIEDFHNTTTYLRTLVIVDDNDHLMHGFRASAAETSVTHSGSPTSLSAWNKCTCLRGYC
jgi:hypothetical protein